jgi:cathepsin L
MARVFAAGVAVAAAGAPDLSSYSYEQWMNKYGIVENSAEAEATFNENLAGIQEHNTANAGFWLEPNKFMTMNREQFKTFVKGRSSTGHLFQGQMKKAELDYSAVPDSKDWRDVDGVVSDVKDQGGCGSCWAFSAVETLESHLSIATGTASPKLSPQQIVSCSPNPQHCGGTGGCDGSTQPLAFDYTKTAGITTEANYAYRGSTGTCDTSKIQPVAFNDGYTELTTNNYTELVTAAGTVGPVAISIAASGFKFQFYGGGVLSNCNDYVMDHAVQLVGYGTDSGKDYWLVRNSWGNWGEKGYIRMQRYGEGSEPCGTDKSPQDGDACDGDTAPRTYCGECGILSSSSYPTGMRAASVQV